MKMRIFILAMLILCAGVSGAGDFTYHGSFLWNDIRAVAVRGKYLFCAFHDGLGTIDLTLDYARKRLYSSLEPAAASLGVRRMPTTFTTDSVRCPAVWCWAIHPAYGYFITMMLISIGLNLLGIFRLRKWNPRGEPIMQREGPQEIIDTDESIELEKRAKAHAAAVAGNSATNPVRSAARSRYDAFQLGGVHGS